MSSEITFEIAVAGKWDNRSIAPIKRMLGTLSSDSSLITKACEAIKSESNDGVSIRLPSGDIACSDGSFPAVVLAVFITKAVGKDAVINSFSERLKQVIRFSPVVLLAHESPATEAAGTILEIKRQIAFSNWQHVSEIDLSDPMQGTVHPTWHAEVGEPKSTLKASVLSDDVTGTRIVLEAKAAFIDVGAGTMHLFLDQPWCFETAQRRSARPSAVTRADPGDGPRKRLNSLTELWLQNSDHAIVWESEQSSKPKLHPGLSVLQEKKGQVSYRPNHPTRWSDRINELSPHDIAELIAAIETIWENAHPEVADTVMRSEGLEAYRALIDGQCSALEFNTPPDPEKLASKLSNDVDRLLSEAIESLSSHLIAKIKHGDAAQNMVSRLGRSNDVLKEDSFRFFMPGPKPFDHQAKLRISENGQIRTSDRISTVMGGVCQAHSEILQLYWLRVIRPSVFVEINKQMQYSESVTPRLTDFDINQTGFEGLEAKDIRDKMKWPKEQSTTKLFNLSFYLKEIMKMVRLFGRLAGLAIVVGVGVSIGGDVGIFEKGGIFGSDNYKTGIAVCKEAPYFGCERFLQIKTIWSEYSILLVSMLVILCLTIAPSLFKLFGLRAEVREKIGKALEPCVEAKLTELAGSWKKHLDDKKSQFVIKLKLQIEEQLESPITQRASRQLGALAHVHADDAVATAALKSVSSQRKKNESDIADQEAILKKISREVAKI